MAYSSSWIHSIIFYVYYKLYKKKQEIWYRMASLSLTTYHRNLLHTNDVQSTLYIVHHNQKSGAAVNTGKGDGPIGPPPSHRDLYYAALSRMINNYKHTHLTA